MKILISGSSGLVGSSLLPFLNDNNHEVLRLVRFQPTAENEIQWLPDQNQIDLNSAGQIDAVVHLAGESIADRWNEEKKNKIRESRIKGTKLISDTISQLEQKPKVFISASAIGYYGNRGNEILTEDSVPGDDFLARVCRDWETACLPVSDNGIRSVQLRFGVILSPSGGALAKMLPVFRLGQGGKLGHGRQYMSWVNLEDVTNIIDHVLRTDTLHGPVNVVAPNPVTNSEFTNTLGRVLRRPTIVPGFLGQLATSVLFGQMSEALLLASQRVEPTRLNDSGYNFQYQTLESALRQILSR
ncbi:MAG: TIGR01777 family oxidoreductase [Candidatus Poribacteria bacterium]|nr:TIGR01777 family oxidoreductase [Candidatus Poribacteria bacterium]